MRTSTGRPSDGDCTFTLYWEPPRCFCETTCTRPASRKPTSSWPSCALLTPEPSSPNARGAAASVVRVRRWRWRRMSDSFDACRGTPARPWVRPGSRVEAVELAEHLQHHLVRATADRQQPAVPEVPRHPGLLHVAQ